MRVQGSERAQMFKEIPNMTKKEGTTLKYSSTNGKVCCEPLY